MRYVLFDLGDTLESHDTLRPGARDMLRDITRLRDDHGHAPKLGLISDFDMPTTPSEVPTIEGNYRQLLKDLGIEEFFQPFKRAITLSTQVGVFKPDRKIFRAALDKFDRHAHFQDAIFITENVAHVAAALQLGMHALHLKGPDQPHGEIDALPDLVAAVARFVRGESS